MIDYNSFTSAVIKANKEIYGYLKSHMSTFDLQYSQTTGFGGDNSLNIDLKAEEVFISYLQNFGDIYSEEIGLISSNSNIKIIIDPIDGSHNLQTGLPYFGSSVALKIDGEYKAGYVANFANGTMIYRVDDGVNYIFLEDEKVFNPCYVNEPSIGIFERAYAYPDICQSFFKNGIKFRSPGAAALSLANARNYSFVVFAGKLREFDIAASLHINGDLFIYKNSEFLIVSKNEQILEQIKGFIKNNRL